MTNSDPEGGNTMNNDTCGSRVRWRGWPQGAAILIVIVSIALLTAACGGGTSAGSGASPSATSTYAKLVAYAQCVRSHGVPNFPDPSSNGAFNASSINLHSAQVQSAQNACKSLQPNLGTSGQSQAQNVTQKLKFAQCMRSHGVPNFPDPSSNGKFQISKSINTQSATYKKAQQACQSITSSGPGQQSGGGS
jgi:hypothetical protein